MMVMLAVASLIFLSAFAVGINDAMVRNSVGLFSGHISAAELPVTLTPRQLKIPGVTQVLRRLELSGRMIGSRQSLAVRLLGIDPSIEHNVTAFHRKILRGGPLSDGDNKVLLGQVTAEQLGVGVGDPLKFEDMEEKAFLDVIVGGIFKTGMPALDQGTVFCSSHLIAGRTEKWGAAVFIKENRRAEDIVAAYDRHWGRGDQFKTWREIMPDLEQLIQLNYISMGIVMLLVMGVVAVGIAATFVVFIFKSLREYGIMKAMGVTNGEIVLLILLEVGLINGFACLGGEALGIGATLLFSHTGIDLTAWTSHNQYFAVSGIIFPRLTAYSLFLPPCIALGFGTIAAGWPALVVARRKAVEVLSSM